GMPMFQVNRMVSNMLGGAIEVASNDSDTVTPALRMRSSASRGLPARPSRNSEWVAHDSGVLVLAISSASISRRNEMAQQQLRAEPAAALELFGVDPVWRRLRRVQRDRQLAFDGAGHVDQESGGFALRMTAQVQPEVDQPFERGAGCEILLPD